MGFIYGFIDPTAVVNSCGRSFPHYNNYYTSSQSCLIEHQFLCSSFPLFVSLGTSRMLSELILSDRGQFTQNHCPYLHVFSALIIAGLRSVEENDVWWQRDSRNQQNHDLSDIKPKISWCQLTFRCCWCSLLFATCRGWPWCSWNFISALDVDGFCWAGAGGVTPCHLLGGKLCLWSVLPAHPKVPSSEGAALIAASPAKISAVAGPEIGRAVSSFWEGYSYTGPRLCCWDWLWEAHVGQTCILCKQPCWPTATKWVLNLPSSDRWMVKLFPQYFINSCFKI